MMFEQIVLMTLLLGWLFYRFAIQDEARQRLLDLASDRGIRLSDERAARAAAAGTTGQLRERILESQPAGRMSEPVPQGRGGDRSNTLSTDR